MFDLAALSISDRTMRSMVPRDTLGKPVLAENPQHAGVFPFQHVFVVGFHYIEDG